MGASMDSAALKKGVLAHASAIGHVDSKGMIPLPDYTAIKAAIGHMVASVPKNQVIDVFNAAGDVVRKEEVGAYMKSLVNSGRSGIQGILGVQGRGRCCAAMRTTAWPPQ
ncbi:unnamed protein product [Polarella glacialis]|uniref:Uncharacterized protein n=1 Tax=Polarella glacialis TaxID=89957 RepID=A0A813DV48_POLGL|nr:unnamed protein product [Polarella glacialis]